MWPRDNLGTTTSRVRDGHAANRAARTVCARTRVLEVWGTVQARQVHCLTGDQISIFPLIPLIVVYRNTDDLSPAQYDERFVADVIMTLSRTWKSRATLCMRWPVLSRSIASWRSFSDNRGQRSILTRKVLCAVRARYTSAEEYPFMLRWVIGSIPYGGPVELFSFQPVLRNWINKGCDMYCFVYGMVYIKYPLLLIEKSTPWSGGSGFPFFIYLDKLYCMKIKCVECVVK